MNDKWIDFAIKIQSIAQAGLQYGKDKFDLEQYSQLREISAQMIAEKTNISTEKIKDLFCNETGYQTPKIDTRVAIFEDDKILLVHENNGEWSMPGGWCDVDMSIASNTIKESKEETGLDVEPEKIIAVQDWRKHNVCNFAYGVIKIFVLCKNLGGNFENNIETTETCYFDKNNLPKNLSINKSTKEQILMCFESYETNNQKTIFD